MDRATDILRLWALSALLLAFGGCAGDSIDAGSETLTDGESDTATTTGAGETSGTGATVEPETSSTASTASTSSTTTDTTSTTTETTMTAETSDATSGTGDPDDGIAIPGCGDHVLVADGPLQWGGIYAEQDFADFCAHYDGIDGDLDIYNPLYPLGKDEYAPMLDLAGLACLRCVTGELRIEHAVLGGLGGLEGLTYAGALDLRELPDLAALDGLTGLKEVGGTLRISTKMGYSWISALTSLSGLDALARVGALEITENDALLSLEGAAALTQVGALVITENRVLKDLDGLLGITAATRVEIRGNDGLTNLHGLEGLAGPVESLTLDDNPLLLDLVGAPAIAAKGSLRISGSPELVGLWGLAPPPEDLTHVVLVDLPKLQSLASLGGLTRIHGTLQIDGCGSIHDLSGLEGLESVAGALVLQDNGSLQSISALSGLSGAQPRALTLAGSPLLTSLDGLQGITAIRGVGDDWSELAPDCYEMDLSIEGLGITDLGGLSGLQAIGSEHPADLVLHDLPALHDLTGLGAVGSLAYLWIYENPALANIDALASLTVSEGIDIVDNDALVDLKGLGSLLKVGASGLTITDNLALASLDPLTGLAAIAGTLEIANNCALTDADAKSLAAAILEGGGVIGSVEIDGNGALCQP